MHDSPILKPNCSSRNINFSVSCIITQLYHWPNQFCFILLRHTFKL